MPPPRASPTSVFHPVVGKYIIATTAHPWRCPSERSSNGMHVVAGTLHGERYPSKPLRSRLGKGLCHLHRLGGDLADEQRRRTDRLNARLLGRHDDDGARGAAAAEQRDDGANDKEGDRKRPVKTNRQDRRCAGWDGTSATTTSLTEWGEETVPMATGRASAADVTLMTAARVRNEVQNRAASTQCRSGERRGMRAKERASFKRPLTARTCWAASSHRT